MKLNEKMQICQLVAQAILSDGHITDSEHDFISNLMEKYGLTNEDQQKVMNTNIDDNPAELIKDIKGFETTNELIVELALAVAADGVLSKTEKELIGEVAKAIHIEESDIDMLVKNALM